MLLGVFDGISAHQGCVFQIYHGRKTDQCGVFLFGTEGNIPIRPARLCARCSLCVLQETKNLVNAREGGYDHVYEYLPIAQPNAATLAKMNELQASTGVGDRE